MSIFLFKRPEPLTEVHYHLLTTSVVASDLWIYG